MYTRDTRENFNHFDYFTGNLLRTWALQRATTLARTTYYYAGITTDYTLNMDDHRIFALAGFHRRKPIVDHGMYFLWRLRMLN